MAIFTGAAGSRDSPKKVKIGAGAASSPGLEPCDKPQTAEAARLNAPDDACDDSTR
jgi:hypothetical protein